MFCAVYANGQLTSNLSVDVNRLKSHVTILASDSFQGRKPFTIGETKTVEYLTNYYEKIGVEPGNGKSFIQEVRLVETKVELEPTILVRTNISEQQLQNGKDYALYSFAPDGEVILENVEVIFAGYGINAPSFGRNDYKGIDVTGKVVMVLMNERNQKESSLQKGRSVTYYENPEYKVQEAARQGAKACLLVQPANAMASMQFIQSSLNASKLHLPDDTGVSVMGYMNRPAFYKVLLAGGLDSTVLTQADRKDFRAFSTGVTFSTSLRTVNQYKTTRNVVAKISGSERSKEAIVYSAHWDHLGIGRPDAKGDSIYNGASDNAIGIAVLLELAVAFKKSGIKPKRTIVFLCATAEEMGHFGSLWYVKHTPPPQSKTVANINLDGFNRYGKTKDVSIIGEGHTELEDYLAKEVKKQGRYLSPDPDPEQNNYFGSDHLSFAKAGIPGLFFIRGIDYVDYGKDYEAIVRKNYYSYHTPSDEYNSGWRFDGTSQDMELIFNLGKLLANNVVFPKWKPSSEFNYKGLIR